MNKMDLIQLIEEQFNHLLKTRAFFPYLNENMIGKNQFSTAPFYKEKLGTDIKFIFDRKLDQTDIDEINSIAHWINQNYIIRLYSILEQNRICGKSVIIDQNVDGWEDVDLLIRLRNKFAHSSGKYNSRNNVSKSLYKKLVERYKLKDVKSLEEANEFPLSIDTVLEPLTEGCKKYISSRK